ncbi:MAG: DUF4446 family protein [bacterium]|nr:DUF4446 family protein [bacterium]
MSEFIAANTTAMLLVAVGTGVLASVLAIVAISRINAAVKPFSMVKDGSEDPAELLPAILQTVEKTEVGLQNLTARLNEHLENSRVFFRAVSLIRYDAFDDIGGKQSYSICLLDADKNGILLTYLTSINTTRSYAVAIESGEAGRELSEEEGRALAEAVAGNRTAAVN